jgi:hypothetical protein
MKPKRKDRNERVLNEIVAALKSMPRPRLRVVRDVIGALAEPIQADQNGAKSKHRGRKSLLKTPFCGIWEGRTDIGNGRSYARALRQRLESRGDRT